MSLIILNELLDLKNLGIDTHFMKIGHKLAKNIFGSEFCSPLENVFSADSSFFGRF
jgi:hypothetical protein